MRERPFLSGLRAETERKKAFTNVPYVGMCGSATPLPTWIITWKFTSTKHCAFGMIICVAGDSFKIRNLQVVTFTDIILMQLHWRRLRISTLRLKQFQYFFNPRCSLPVTWLGEAWTWCIFSLTWGSDKQSCLGLCKTGWHNTAESVFNFWVSPDPNYIQRNYFGWALVWLRVSGLCVDVRI